jgi:DNA-binding Lrp family transcriptional regulator
MREPDETDLEIIELLMSDARQSWNDIAGTVDLSPPAVSDRVARLQEMGSSVDLRSTSIGRNSMRAFLSSLHSA